MSAKVQFKDYSDAWLRVQEQNLTNAIEAMADAIMKVSKAKTPKKSNKLRESSHINRLSKTSREITYGGHSVKYAEYQERGRRQDGSHVVRHYTTAGTQAHYLQQTGDQIVKQGIKAYLK